MSNANSIAVGGTHYKGVEIEHWDYALLALNNRYLEGNITKYVARHRRKNGLQDLEKAKHYMIKLIESVPVLVDPIGPQPASIQQFVGRFSEQNVLSPIETGIMILMASWKNRGDLVVIDSMIDSLVRQYQLSEPTSGYVNQGD